MIGLTGASTSVWGKSLYITTVNKTEVPEFLDRLPGDGVDHVVTSAPLSMASDHLRLDHNHKLYAVHLESSPPKKKLDTKAIKKGQFIFLALDPDRAHQFSHQQGVKLIEVQTSKTLKRDRRVGAFHFQPARARDLKDWSQWFDQNITEAELKIKLEEFSGWRKIRLGKKEVLITERKSNKGKDLAKEYMKRELEPLGFRFELQPYRSGQNMIAKKVGKLKDQWIVASAHLDSVGNAGADDDGSGMIALIAIAKFFSQFEHQPGIRLLGFDEEERGLIGSGRWRSMDPDAQKIRGALHFDMIGWDSNDDGRYHILDCQEGRSPELTQLFQASVKMTDLKLQQIPACRRASDHIRFWQLGIPAIMLIEIRQGDRDINPHYHRRSDKVDTINMGYMTKIIKASILTLAQMAQ